MNAIWVKKQVNKKQQTFYESIPAYKTLYLNDSGAIIAFRIIEGYVPDTVIPCTIEEVDRLEKKRTETFGKIV